MAIDPPYRLDPFRNIINISWEPTTYHVLERWWTWLEGPQQSPVFKSPELWTEPCEIDHWETFGISTLEQTLIEWIELYLHKRERWSTPSPNPSDYFTLPDWDSRIVRGKIPKYSLQTLRTKKMADYAASKRHLGASCSPGSGPTQEWILPFTSGTVDDEFLATNEIVQLLSYYDPAVPGEPYPPEEWL